MTMRDDEHLLALAHAAKPKEWKATANCIGVPDKLFFPERGDMRAVAQAREVCRGCVSRLDCLEFSNTYPVEKFGVWGGYSADERRHMRAGRRVVRHFA